MYCRHATSPCTQSGSGSSGPGGGGTAGVGPPCHQVGRRNTNLLLSVVSVPRKEVPTSWLYGCVEWGERVTHVLPGAARLHGDMHMDGGTGVIDVDSCYMQLTSVLDEPLVVIIVYTIMYLRSGIGY